MDPREVHTAHVVEHLAEMKDRGLAPRSLRSRRQAILTFFNWALGESLVKNNPALRVRPTKVPKRPKGFLDPGDFQKLLAQCPRSTIAGARRRAMLWLFAGTGMRRQELALLELSDLNWDLGQIRIVHGKGQKQRTAPFPKAAQEPMLKYLAFRKDDLPNLWVTEEFRPLSYDGIGHDLARLRDRAGLTGQIQDICHIFRRTAAANAEEAGMSPSHILAGFGWESPTMLNHYVTAKRLEQGKAVESFAGKDPLGKWLNG